MGKFDLAKRIPIGTPKAVSEDQTKETVAKIMEAGQKTPDAKNEPPLKDDERERALASIATCVLKAKNRLKNADPAKTSEVLERVNADLDRVWKVFADDLGWEIQDHTGKDYDYGMALKIVTTERKPGLKKERVIDTVKPTIYSRNKERIQMGEVVVGTPD